MAQARTGSSVTISYIGTLEDGTIFHSTEKDGPLTLTLGTDQLFPALERAIIGMRAGEARNIVLTAAEGYGPRREENIIRVGREAFGAREVKPGQKLSIDFASGASRVMLVSAVSETEVTLDGNHPLAGLELTFALRVDRVE